MKLNLKLLFQRSRFAEDQDEYSSRLGLLRRFPRNEEGSILVYLTLAIPVLIGIAALGTEGGFWLYKKRVLQSAADNAAYSAAAAYAASKTSDITAQARAITANDYNLVHGVNNVTVAVNRPPAGGCYAGTSNYAGANAIEVIVTEPQPPRLSSIWLSSNVNICGRGVAIVPSSGDCILALATTGAGINTVGKVNNLDINLTDCSLFSNSTDAASITMTGNNNTIRADSVGTAGGIDLNGNSKSTIFNSSTGDPRVADPYSSDAASWPQTGGAAQTNCLTKNGSCTNALTPGVYSSIYLGNTTTMSPGIYYVTGDMQLGGNNMTLDATGGVTIVLTGPTSALKMTGNHITVNITAPGSGWNSGIAIWEPTSTGTNNLVGNNSTLNITGVLYTPSATMQYTGNSGADPVCTQIVANRVQFDGNSINLKGDCTSVPGMKVFGQISALVE